MLSIQRQARRLRLILPLILLALPACVGAPPIVASQSACSQLIPSEWREGVPGADLPKAATVGAWIAFADAQTGQLDKANERTAAAIGIVERCEERDRAAVRKSRRRFFGIF